MRSLWMPVLLALASANSVHADLVTWNASSGLFPNQISPAYTLNDSSAAANPVLSGGVLTINTMGDNADKIMYYTMSGSSITIPSQTVITFRMRFVTGDTASNRAGAGVSIVTQSGVGQSLWVGADEMFLLQFAQAKGVSVSGGGFDTNDAFHNYRIEVDGAATGSTIRVYQDNALKLTSATYTNASLFGTTPAIAFGEGTIVVRGQSEWTSFEHNAGTTGTAAVPEPTTFTLLTLAALGFTGYGWRRHRHVSSK